MQMKGETVSTNGTQENRDAEAARRERQLLRRVFESHEKNRQSIAQQIHEGIAQQLIAALLQLRDVEPLAAASPVARTAVSNVAETLNVAIDEARSIAGRLRLPIFREFGIEVSIEYLINEVNRNGDLRVVFLHPDTPVRATSDLETTVFRVVQELLANVRRHSRSKRLLVDLSLRGDHLRIEVRDWGVGFDPESVGDDRFGLQEVMQAQGFSAAA